MNVPIVIISLVGAGVLTYLALWPALRLAGFFLISDYGFWDTLRWNFWPEKLWIEIFTIPGCAFLWWLIVGRTFVDILGRVDVSVGG